MHSILLLMIAALGGAGTLWALRSSAGVARGATSRRSPLRGGGQAIRLAAEGGVQGGVQGLAQRSALIARTFTGVGAQPGNLASVTRFLYDQTILGAQRTWPDGNLVIPSVWSVTAPSDEVEFGIANAATIERGVNQALIEFHQHTPLQMNASVRFIWTVDDLLPPARMVVSSKRIIRPDIPPTSTRTARSAAEPDRSIHVQRTTPVQRRPAVVLHPVGEAGDPEPFVLSVGTSLVGRDPARCTVVLRDGSVSRVHGRISVREVSRGAVEVRVSDSGDSANGTWVRRPRQGMTSESRLDGEEVVEHGDELFFGDVRLRVVVGDSAMMGTEPFRPAGHPSAGAGSPDATTQSLSFDAVLNGNRAAEHGGRG